MNSGLGLFENYAHTIILICLTVWYLVYLFLVGDYGAVDENE
jgi:hypothetical protein